MAQIGNRSDAQTFFYGEQHVWPSVPHSTPLSCQGKGKVMERERMKAEKSYFAESLPEKRRKIMEEEVNKMVRKRKHFGRYFTLNLA